MKRLLVPDENVLSGLTGKTLRRAARVFALMSGFDPHMTEFAQKLNVKAQPTAKVVVEGDTAVIVFRNRSNGPMEEPWQFFVSDGENQKSIDKALMGNEAVRIPLPKFFGNITVTRLVKNKKTKVLESKVVGKVKTIIGKAHWVTNDLNQLVVSIAFFGNALTQELPVLIKHQGHSIFDEIISVADGKTLNLEMPNYPIVDPLEVFFDGQRVAIRDPGRMPFEFADFRFVACQIIGKMLFVTVASFQDEPMKADAPLTIRQGPEHTLLAYTKVKAKKNDEVEFKIPLRYLVNKVDPLQLFIGNYEQPESRIPFPQPDQPAIIQVGKKLRILALIHEKRNVYKLVLWNELETSIKVKLRLYGANLTFSCERTLEGHEICSVFVRNLPVGKQVSLWNGKYEVGSMVGPEKSDFSYEGKWVKIPNVARYRFVVKVTKVSESVKPVSMQTSLLPEQELFEGTFYSVDLAKDKSRELSVDEAIPGNYCVVRINGNIVFIEKIPTLLDQLSST